MTYSKKKLFNKLSITKNQAWSLILEAKSIFCPSKRETKTITIKNNSYSFVYNFDKRKIIKKNFYINEKVKELFDIFLPMILNKNNPYIIGHLAQSLDGFIATHSGESKYISCKENIEHIHRIRAISDAIVVGANTILYDNPKLTTRLVKGKSPMRLILDPTNKIKGTEKVFKNPDRNSFKIISDKNKNNKNSLSIPTQNNKFKKTNLISLFKKLNKRIIFIEGGGYTISDFYKKNILNRLHLCISPTIIGDGKNSFLIEKRKLIKDFKKHKIQYFKMGNDILCDIELIV